MEQDAPAGAAARAGGAPHARGTVPRLQLGGVPDQRPVMAKAEHAVRTADEAATLGRLTASTGRPLAPELAQRLGRVLGHDVTHVVIHTDGVAAAAAAQLGARAFTIGNEIYFAAGAYAPDSADGERLLLHELTHVRQHDRGALAAVGEGQSRVSSPGDAHEHEARAMESRGGTPREHGAERGAEPHTQATRGAAGDRAPVLRDVHGIPNEGNDCFMSAVLQLLATNYATLFDPAVNSLAPERRPLQAELDRFLAAIRGGQAPAYKRGDTKRLRALLQLHGLIETTAGQEDAARLLGKLLDFVLSLEGRRLMVNRVARVVPPGATLSNRALGVSKAELLHENPELAILEVFTFDRASELSFQPSDAKPRVASTTETNVSKYDASGASKRVEADLSMVDIEMSQYDSFEQFMGQRYGVGIDDELRPGHEHAAVDHHDAPIAISKLHRTFAFARLPQVITFAVQRFFGDLKLNDEFSMPREMVLKEAGPPLAYCEYELRAMVIHDSASAERGHYLAEVDDEQDNHGWQTANDGHVAPNAKNEPRRLSQGYLYSYVLRQRGADAPAKPAVQDTKPEPRKRTLPSARPSGGLGTGGLGSVGVGTVTGDKRGLPNVGRGERGKSDCFVNAIVQLAAGPYRTLFDPKQNPLDEADQPAQKLVWTLIGKIDKTDPKGAVPSDVTALRDEIVRRGYIQSVDRYEDASEVLVRLLELVRGGKAGAMATSKSRTLDLTDARDLEVSAEASKGFKAYQDGKATDDKIDRGNGYLPVDIRQFSNIHQFLYQAYGAGGERTTFKDADRPRVSNNGRNISVTGFTEHTTIVALPPVLTFQLKRLPAEAATAKGRAAGPDLRPFYMPPSLVLVEQADADTRAYVTYQLQGVVTWQASHYTARVAHGEQWYDFNDEQVRATPGSGDVLTGGYLYTYVAGARVAKPPSDATVLQETAPRAGTVALGTELTIDYDANAIMHPATQRNLRAVLQAIGGHYPVLVDPQKGLAVAKALSLLEGLGLLSASGVTPESDSGQAVITSCREVVTALGATSLAEAYRGKLAAPLRTSPQFEQRGAQGLAPFLRPLDGKDTDLSKLKVAEIRLALTQRKLTDGPELQAYLQFRARKEFYEQVHLVYDLDQTLITYNDGVYTPPAEHGDVSGALALKFETRKPKPRSDEASTTPEDASSEPAPVYPFEIDALVPSDTSSSDHQATYRRHGDDRSWRQHYRPKTGRERRETGETVDMMGKTLGGPSPETAPSRGAPSNQKGRGANVRAISIRPGTLEALQELDGYGVHQSVWTHNSEHHMHRVLELFEARGFAEHRFDKTVAAKGTALKGKKPLTEFEPKVDQTTLLLDDAPNRGNKVLGNLGGKDALAPVDSARTGELQVPAWGDPGDKFADAGNANNLLGLLGDRLMVRLALGQVKPAAEADDPLSREFLDAMKAIVSPSPSALVDDAGLLAALDVFLSSPDAKNKLRAGFQRFQPPAQHPGEDPSLFALTPSLGASLIFPDRLPPATKPDDYDETAAKTEAKKGYKGANIVSRGLIETEVHGKQRFVRVYQAEANAIPRKDATTTIFKDVHQVEGTIDLVKGKGEVCFSVGTPLRTLKWFEKYQEEHFGKGFNPVIRSFLVPLDAYVDMASRATVQEQSSHPRYQGHTGSTNVDIAGDTDQYETREADLEMLRTRAVSGSLVSWALDSSRLEGDMSGEIRPIRELYGRLGITPFSGIFTATKLAGDQLQTYDPFTEKGGHRLTGMVPRATELAELHATHLEHADGVEPGPFLEANYDGSAKRALDVRTADLSSFVRMHFYNPPEGKRLALAKRIETEIRAPIELKLAKERQAAEWDKQKREALAASKPEPAEPKLAEVRLPHSKIFATLDKPTEEPMIGIRAEFDAARLEYEAYLKAQKPPVSVPATWQTDPQAFYGDVLVPVLQEEVRYKARMARIAEERAHHEAGLRARHQPVPAWTDVEFFLRVLVPNAATQFVVTQSIGDNVGEARDDLSSQHPEHARGFDELWAEHASGKPALAPADTPMKTIDYAERKRDHARVHEGGSALSELICKPSTTAKQILDQFLLTFPELQEKFDEESNPQQYTFYQHAERVIGQYLQHFRAGKHPLVSLPAMVKMILFHDMDKFRGRALSKSKDPTEMAKVVKHTGLSPGTINARFARRLALEGPHGDKESAAEHVLPAMMMERYAALWDSPDEARMAIAVMDGDPIGALAKQAAGPKTDALDATRKHAFQEIVAMARRAGIPATDHAGIAAFYYQLLQFYQADSSSYSTAAHHTGEVAPTKRGGTMDRIYHRDSEAVDAPITVNASDADGTYGGFLAFENPVVAGAVAALTKMFDDVGATMAELAKESGGKPVRAKKQKPVVVDSDDDNDPYGLAGFDIFADPPTTPPGGTTTPPGTTAIDVAISTVVAQTTHDATNGDKHATDL